MHQRFETALTEHVEAPEQFQLLGGIATHSTGDLVLQGSLVHTIGHDSATIVASCGGARA